MAQKIIIAPHIDDDVLDFNIEDNEITITPLDDMNGEIEVFIEVSDGELSDDDSFVLTVVAQPDPPELVEISNQEINEDESFAIILNASDIDGDELSYFASSDIDGTVVSIEDNLLIINSPLNYYGEMLIAYGVTDGIFNIEQEFMINYVAQPDPPIISGIPDQEVLEAEVINISVDVVDPDEDDISLSLSISDDINYIINNFHLLTNFKS